MFYSVRNLWLGFYPNRLWNPAFAVLKRKLNSIYVCTRRRTIDSLRFILVGFLILEELLESAEKYIVGDYSAVGKRRCLDHGQLQTTIALFVFYMFVPAYFAVCKQVFLKHVHESHFLAAVAKTYFTAAVVSLVIWLVWQATFSSSWTEARLILNDRLYCTPYIKYDMDTKAYSYCSKPAPLCATLIILKTALHSFHPTTLQTTLYLTTPVRGVVTTNKKMQHANWGL